MCVCMCVHWNLILDGTYVLGLDLESCLLFCYYTENQSMSSPFIWKENEINKLLTKVTDRGKDSMKKLLTETGEETSPEREFILSCIM